MTKRNNNDMTHDLFDNLGEIQLEKALRQAVISELSQDSREITVIFASNQPVLTEIVRNGQSRRFYERLSIDPQSMNLERVEAGLCNFIESHEDRNTKAIVGRVIPGSVVFADGSASCRIALSSAEDVQSTVVKIIEGIARGVSLGFSRQEVQRTSETIDGLPVINTTRYTMSEISVIPVPADTRTGIIVTRSEGTETYRCIVKDEGKVEEESASGVTMPTNTNLARRASMPKKAKTEEIAVDEQEVVEDAATRSAKEVDTLHRVEIEVSGQEKAKRSAPKKAEEVAEAVLDEAAIRSEAIKEYKERKGEVEKIARSLKLDDAWVAEKVDSDESLDAIRSAAIDSLVEKDEMSKNSTGARGSHPDSYAKAANRDDDYIEVVSQTLARRAMPDRFKVKEGEKVDRSFEDFTLMDLAAHAAQRAGHGVSTSKDVLDIVFEPGQRAGGGNHVTTDFPDIMNSLTRTLMLAAYEDAEVIYPEISTTISLPDFRDTTLMRYGSFPALEEVIEGEDYPAGTFSTGTEKIALKHYGRTLKVTRQLLVNDNLGVIASITTDIGSSARQTIEDQAVGLLLTNPNLSNTRAVFNTTDGNALANNAGTNISNSNLADVYDRFSKLKGLDGRPIRVRPSILLTGTGDRWVEAQQLLGSFDPTTASEVSVFRARYRHIDTPIISNHASKSGAWFALADPSQFRAGLQVAFLNGQQAPRVDTEVRSRNGGIETNVSLDFNVGVGDRNFGFYNPGT